jgi:hypothetical protein
MALVADKYNEVHESNKAAIDLVQQSGGGCG